MSVVSSRDGKSGKPRNEFAMHKAVFEKDHHGVAELLKDQYVASKDIHGNTPLHLAVMLGYKEVISLLLKYNAPVKVKNAQGWSPLSEAVSYGDRQIIVTLLRSLKLQSKENISGRKPQLVDALRTLGDFYMELRWDFHSWIPLVSKLLPSDVCKIYKKGTKIRMDTTLVDFNEKSWERGDISFVFDPAAKACESLVILDNNAKVYQWMRYEESDLEIEDEVDILMSSDIVNAQISTKQLEFNRAQVGFLFAKHDRNEEVGNFNAEFYDIDGLVLVSRKRREHLTVEDVAKNKSLIESLQRGAMHEGVEFKIPRRKSLAPPGLCQYRWAEYIGSDPGNPPNLARPQQVKKNVKKFRAIVGMSKDFPLNIDQLLDILEITAPFKHIQKLRDFCDFKLPDGFPIKIEIPLFPTVSAKITFQNFKFSTSISDSMFIVPGSYREDCTRFPDL